MWRSIEEDPEYFEGRRVFWCRVRVGSMAPEIREMPMSGRWTEHHGFKWSQGDWKYVVEWMYLEEKE